ncbi:rap guanine nucleotide exchange factor-like 1 [Pipra filicauda]|uniref:Rap guanine nucleotide exchange factor-like 1 n=1 Tax=Pipra filicauda TaxID=649802 RepID=A0A6J2IQN2_9PASS|nr:rap guanine nucleotide exchange factor-like 1 [Pipra filicauda]
MKPLEKLLKKPGSHLPARPAAPPGQVPGPGSLPAPRRQSLSRPAASPEEPPGPAGPVPGGEGRWLELRPPEVPLRSPEEPSPGGDRDRDRERDREPPSPEPPPAARCCCGCGCAPAAPAPPERLLTALLDRLPAAEHGKGCGAESLLDDIVLTHSLFLPTERFLQQLHQHFVLAAGSPPRWEEGAGLQRKRAVLAVLLHFLETYKGLLQEEESAGKVIKELYLLIMKDTSLYHDLEDEILKLHQLVETVELKVADETPPPNKQVKPLFRHFRRIDSCLQTRVAFRGSDEIFCRVYLPDHSYVTIRSRLSASVQDILASVTEKLQYSEEQSTREDALILVTMASSGEKAVLQPSEECVFTTLGINSHLFACTRDTFDSLVPLPEEIQVVPGDTEIHRVEPEDVANHLTAFHWELFRCIHELEFVDYVFHGERGRRETANLELLLQRCSEVQHWVGTELLLCEGLGKRAHLLKKLIKIAAICKQNQDMLSFYAIVIGLNNAAVSRLRLTWEKLPGKFKNLFRKFENLTDPCRNHKTYREVLAKMKPPLIPFVPLILKDLTFLHEGSKTLLDGLVNVEKLHCIAEKVRTVRKYRSRPLCLELEASPAQLQTKAYVRQLRVIDNQNLLFELSYKLEPGSQ